jgi:hypothetical protein
MSTPMSAINSAAPTLSTPVIVLSLTACVEKGAPNIEIASDAYAAASVCDSGQSATVRRWLCSQVFRTPGRNA